MNYFFCSYWEIFNWTYCPLKQTLFFCFIRHCEVRLFSFTMCVGPSVAPGIVKDSRVKVMMFSCAFSISPLKPCFVAWLVSWNFTLLSLLHLKAVFSRVCAEKIRHNQYFLQIYWFLWKNSRMYLENYHFFFLRKCGWKRWQRIWLSVCRSARVS